ncbi:MAG: hypothetical protein KDD76_01350, partial [Rickettsiales bacterium]|nr:hypothetical protein [Rickettsiales bacterium]
MPYPHIEHHIESLTGGAAWVKRDTADWWGISPVSWLMMLGGVHVVLWTLIPYLTHPNAAL